jgi:hypothetical protein
VRVGSADFDRLAVPAGGRVGLRLPQHAERTVCLRRSWAEAPFVWLEFEPAPVEVVVDAAEVMPVGRRSS